MTRRGQMALEPHIKTRLSWSWYRSSMEAKAMASTASGFNPYPRASLILMTCC